MNRPALTDFSQFGLLVGHATDADGATGLTVIRGADGPFRAAVALVGRASGTRELATASPEHLVDRMDAILLTGGSAYGLDAAAGVMRWMEARGRGFPVGAGVVPIVPAATIFDLAPLGRFEARPSADMAHAACDAAMARVTEGSVGAGTGATVGKAFGPAAAMKGGLGAGVVSAGDAAVGALAVVNAFGDVRDAAGAIIAGARGPDGFVDSARRVAEGAGAPARFGDVALQNTTLALVATNVALDRQALTQLARAATAALYRRITPAGTTFDGDTVFAVCPLAGGPDAPAVQLEAMAVAALEQAIERAVRLAVGRDGVPGLADAS